MGVARCEGIIGANGQLPLGLERAYLHPAHQGAGEFESAVFHQLRVETAVGAEIDILEKNAPHGGVDPGARVIDAHGYGGAAERARASQGKKQQRKEQPIGIHLRLRNNLGRLQVSRKSSFGIDPFT